MEKQDAVDDERLRLPNPFTLPSFSLEKWSYMSLFDPGAPSPQQLLRLHEEGRDVVS